MSYLDRLPPEYRRRRNINIAMFVVLAIAIWVLRKLPAPTVAVVIEWALGLLFLYMFVYPGVQLARARPRPGARAFWLYGALAAAFVWVILTIVLNGPGVLALLVYWILLMTFFIAYRRVVFPRVGERFRAVRAAQREARSPGVSRDEIRAMFSRDKE